MKQLQKAVFVLGLLFMTVAMLAVLTEAATPQGRVSVDMGSHIVCDNGGPGPVALYGFVVPNSNTTVKVWFDKCNGPCAHNTLVYNQPLASYFAGLVYRFKIEVDVEAGALYAMRARAVNTSTGATLHEVSLVGYEMPWCNAELLNILLDHVQDRLDGAQ
jgi:hypothetical protein